MTSPAPDAVAPRMADRQHRGSPVYLGRSWPVIAVVLVVGLRAQPGRRDGRPVGYLAPPAMRCCCSSRCSSTRPRTPSPHGRGHPVGPHRGRVWGGHTVYDHPVDARSTALIAVVGPLSNLVLAAGVLGCSRPASRPAGAHGSSASSRTPTFSSASSTCSRACLSTAARSSAPSCGVTGRKGVGLRRGRWLGRVVAVGTVLWFVGRPLFAGTGRAFGDRVPGRDRVLPLAGRHPGDPAGRDPRGDGGAGVRVLEPLVVCPATRPLWPRSIGLASGVWPSPGPQVGARLGLGRHGRPARVAVRSPRPGRPAGRAGGGPRRARPSPR